MDVTPMTRGGGGDDEHVAEVLSLPEQVGAVRSRHAARHAHPASAEIERAALVESVENRAVIEQAKGMLMLKHRCDADAAFGVLVELSRQERRKVRDIATDMVLAGSRPRRVIDVTDAVVRSGAVARPGSLP